MQNKKDKSKHGLQNHKKQILIVSMVEDVDKKDKKGYVTSKVKAVMQKLL